MSLPKQLKSARMTDSTLASTIDNRVGDLEQAIADILGLTIDSDVTESPLGLGNAGTITKALLRHKAAGPVGTRLLDSTTGKEYRFVLSGTNLLIDENTGSEGTPSWTNRLTIGVSLFPFTKGDILAATNTTTLAKVPVGSDGQGLIADSGAAAGLSYADPGAPSVETLYAQITDSDEVSNTTTETAFNRGLTLPPNTLSVGDIITVNLRVRCAVDTGANLRLRLKIGGVVVLDITSAAPTTPVQMQFVGIVRSVGASAVLELGPHWQAHTETTPHSDLADAADFVNIDTTSALAVGLTAKWDTASPGCTTTQTAMTVTLESPVLTQ